MGNFQLKLYNVNIGDYILTEIGFCTIVKVIAVHDLDVGCHYSDGRNYRISWDYVIRKATSEEIFTEVMQS